MRIVKQQFMLQALEHEQQPKSIKTDNKTAGQLVNKTLKSKRSKLWDMRYFWLTDGVTQQQFYIYRDKRSSNHGDYFTKHWPVNYHQGIRSRYILKGFYVNNPFLKCNKTYCDDKMIIFTPQTFATRFLHKNNTSKVIRQVENSFFYLST